MNHDEQSLTPTSSTTSSATMGAARGRRTSTIRWATVPATVVAGTLMLLADAGQNLGNHNETLIPIAAVPERPRRRDRRWRRFAASTLVVASLGVAAAWIIDGTSNTRHQALAGQYKSSSGGGGVG